MVIFESQKIWKNSIYVKIKNKDIDLEFDCAIKRDPNSQQDLIDFIDLCWFHLSPQFLYQCTKIEDEIDFDELEIELINFIECNLLEEIKQKDSNKLEEKIMEKIKKEIKCRNC